MSNATARFFDDKAPTWSTKYAPGGTLHARIDAFSALVQACCSPGALLLDFGCGTGQIASSLARGGYLVTGADISSKMLAAARAIDDSGRVKWVQIPPDWTELPFESHRFDAIVASSVLEYVDGPERTLTELTRLLAHGGTLLATVPDTSTLIRRWESLIQGAPNAGSLIALLGPRAVRYLEYLRLSSNRLTLSQWRAVGKSCGLRLLRSLTFRNFWMLEFRRPRDP